MDIHSTVLTLQIEHRLTSPLLFKCSDGSVQPSEVFPGACSWLPAAYSSAGPGAGMAAAGDLPAVSASLDAG